MHKLLPWIVAATIAAVVLPRGISSDPAASSPPSATGVATIEAAPGGEAGFAGALPFVWAAEKINAVIGATHRDAGPAVTGSIGAGGSAEDTRIVVLPD